MIRLREWILTGIVCGFAAAACAVDAAPASQPAAAVSTIDGKTVTGEWVGAGADGSIELSDGGKPVRIARDQAMSIRLSPPAATQPSIAKDSFLFYLADGSRFAGSIKSGGSRQISVAAGAAGTIDLPFSRIAAIQFASGGPEDASSLLKRSIESRDPEQDLLITLRDGRATPVRGVLEQVTPEGGTFRWRERSVEFSTKTAFALVLARGSQPTSRAPVLCHLKEGSMWGGELAGGDRKTVRLKMPSGGELTLPVDQISQITFLSDRVGFLSDLTPVEYAFEPFGATQWPYRVDRSVANAPMRLGGQVYDRGLGMHSQGRIVYQLPGPYTQLAATIGIDDAARPRGNVVFRVLADGKEVFNSGPVTGTDAPRPILVALGSPKRVELRVDYGDGVDVGDYADWAQIRLIK